MRLQLTVLACLALSFNIVAMPSAAPDLRAEFWTDLDGIPREGEEFPISDKEAARRILDEAAWVFSGIIDGFDFEWTPPNKGRQIAERFSLVSQGRVMAGDPRLLPGPALRDDLRMSAWIDFRPDETDLRSLESSKVALWKSSQGRGDIDRMRGYAGRREAYVAAIKAGIESYLRMVEPNRPSLARGRVVLVKAPLLAIVAGAYSVQARIRIDILELRRWSIF